jgi:hypothetical protein
MSQADFSPSHATAEVIEEGGRWAVYLSVSYWEFVDEPRLHTVRHRIEDYPTRRLAEIAAQWIARYANRDLPGHPTGF